VPFNEHTTTLLQALGEVSGLQDARSDPKGVFIFRHEPDELVSNLSKKPFSTPRPEGTQVVYNVNLDDPNSFFILNTFPIRPSDIIYVSNSPMGEFQKVVNSVVIVGQTVANTALQAAILAKQN
jgi:polysaccharide export outer membrane protein